MGKAAYRHLSHPQSLLYPNHRLMQMPATIIRGNEVPPYYFQERCYVREILNTPAVQGISIAHITVSPGETTAWHILEESDEQYYILSGSGEMETDGQGLGGVSAGDLVHLPAGTRQRIRNQGETALVFLSICTPRFVPAQYRHLE